MVARFKETGRSQVLVQSTPIEALSEYSVINCDNEVLEPGQTARMTSIVEKPENAEMYNSDLSAVGRYVLSGSIGLFLKLRVMVRGNVFSFLMPLQRCCNIYLLRLIG
jgi:UTP-glucose-1-phosphate uridylyltransferase